MTVLRELQHAVDQLRRNKVGLRYGEVTHLTPFSVRLGGSDIEYRDVKSVGLGLQVGDLVPVLVRGNDLIVLGGISGGGGGGTFQPLDPELTTIAQTDPSVAAALNAADIDELVGNIGAAFDTALPSFQTGAITAYGHSINYIGSSNSVRGCAQRLANILKTDCVMRAVTGSVLSINGTAYGLGAGGWEHLYRRTSHPNSSDWATGPPRRGDCFVFTGINDVTALAADDYADLGPLRLAYEAILSRLLMSNLFEENDASVTVPDGGYTRTGADVAPGAVSSASGGYKRQTTTGGARIQIDVPSTFEQEQVVTLAFLCSPQGYGAQWQISVDGAGAGAVDARNVQPMVGATGYWVPVVFRIKGLTAGAHTIIANPSAINNTAYFDCWWIEAGDPPLICNALQYMPTGIYAKTQAQLDGLNQSITDVVATFGETVFTMDTDDLISDDPDRYLTDGLHPNDRGHAVIGARAADFLQARGRSRTRLQHAKGAHDQPYITRWPNVSDRNVIQPNTPDAVALTVRQANFATAQTADLMQWEELDGTLMGRFAAGGQFEALVSALLGSSEFNAAAFPNMGLGATVGGTGNQLYLGYKGFLDFSPGILFGSGQDTNLYRSAANTLKTDDNLVVAIQLVAGNAASAFGANVGLGGIFGGSSNTVAVGWRSFFDPMPGIAFGSGYDVAVWRRAAGILGINVGLTNPATTSAALGGALSDHFTDAGTTGTGETDLYTDSLPGQTFSSNGTKVTAVYSGQALAHASANRTIRVYLAGTKIFDSGNWTSVTFARTWQVRVEVVRRSSSILRWNVFAQRGLGAAGEAYGGGSGEITGLTLTNAQTLKVTGQISAGSNNDLVAQLGLVRWEAAAP